MSVWRNAGTLPRFRERHEGDRRQRQLVRHERVVDGERRREEPLADHPVRPCPGGAREQDDDDREIDCDPHVCHGTAPAVTRRGGHGERLALWVWSADGLLDGRAGGRSAAFVRPNASERRGEVAHRQGPPWPSTPGRPHPARRGTSCRRALTRRAAGRILPPGVPQVVHGVHGRLESEDGDQEREGEHRPTPRPPPVASSRPATSKEPEPERGRAIRESVRMRVRHVAHPALRQGRIAVKQRRKHAPDEESPRQRPRGAATRRGSTAGFLLPCGV